MNPELSHHLTAQAASKPPLLTGSYSKRTAIPYSSTKANILLSLACGTNILTVYVRSSHYFVSYLRYTISFSCYYSSCCSKYVCTIFPFFMASLLGGNILLHNYCRLSCEHHRLHCGNKLMTQQQHTYPKTYIEKNMNGIPTILGIPFWAEI